MHLDQSFEGLGKIPEELSKALRKQNQQALETMVTRGIEEEIDFLLLVGDTFHQPQVTIQTQSFFIEQMERLKAHDILVILSFGNHDFFQPKKYWFEFPDNVIVFEDEQVSTLKINCRDGLTTAVTGFSYTERWLEDSKLEEFPYRNGQVDYHIGFYHGQIGSNRYGSFSLDAAKFKGYDYWALGHIHQPQVIQYNPLIIYPGSTLKHTQKEKNSGYFVLAEFDGAKTDITWETANDVAWLEVQIEVSQIYTMQELISRCEQTMAEMDEEGLTFVKLVLVDGSEQLNDIMQNIQNRQELLHLLQQDIYQKTNKKNWIFDIKSVQGEEKPDMTLHLDEDLLKQLLSNYEADGVFQEAINDLYRQSTSAQLLSVTEEHREELLQRVMTEFQQLFAAKRGDQ